MGAKTVSPSDELLSWFTIWLPTWVSERRRSKVVNWPPLMRIPVKLSGPSEDGAGACWARVWREKKRNGVSVRMRRERGVEAMSMVVVRVRKWSFGGICGVMESGVGILWDKVLGSEPLLE